LSLRRGESLSRKPSGEENGGTERGIRAKNLFSPDGELPTTEKALVGGGNEASQAVRLTKKGGLCPTARKGTGRNGKRERLKSDHLSPGLNSEEIDKVARAGGRRCKSESWRASGELCKEKRREKVEPINEPLKSSRGQWSGIFSPKELSVEG